MSNSYEPEQVQVGGDQIVVIESQGLEALRVTAGTLWVTDAEGHDLIVAAGQEASLAAPGKIVISGLRGPAAFEHFALQPMQMAA